jgi:3-hydroxyacyl-[acyl-carrier-protein] dehydratase
VKFVDAIQIDTGGASAEGTFFVEPDADYLKDHFPGFPMLPGLLMLEVSVRTAAALWAASASPPRHGAVLEHLDRLQVVRRVAPGETLRVQVRGSRNPGEPASASFTARGSVEDQTALRARFRLRAATQEVRR